MRKVSYGGQGREQIAEASYPGRMRAGKEIGPGRVQLHRTKREKNCPEISPHGGRGNKLKGEHRRGYRAAI